MTAERLPEPERRLTEAEELALRGLCDRFGVEYSEEHYHVYPADSWMMPGYAEGWLGGRRHANPEYQQPEEPVGKPTIFVGVSPEGDVSS